MRRISARALGIIVPGVAACASAAPQSETPYTEWWPRLGVLGRSTAYGPMFSFVECADPNRTVPVNAIIVEKVDPSRPREDGPGVCLIRLASIRVEYPIGAGWVYGSVPGGYKARGCHPLGPGAYKIRASTHGIGGRSFELLADGSMRWLTPFCE